MGRHHTGPMCSSNELTRQLEEIQYSLGEGPCHDAYRSGDPSGSGDLRSTDQPQWPTYTASALAAGACAVFAYPLGQRGAHIGAMTIYQDRVGPLTHDQAENSRVLADVYAEAILSVQADEDSDLLASALQGDGSHRAEVHQASGVVAVQLGIPVGEALDRIRAFGYATDRPLSDIASEIVGGRLHLKDDRGSTERD